ncbi:MAG: hypothetical protein PHV78_04005 [Patescibacteria group bacterium]|nr:hypothetical protein [Patescibacteria group bacterium]MDD5121451.1 hypothetical protein [Patescibacteria group bacterium]MDD5222172.1 hypothetical protein [Patescibacteria group bacterium]MDD5396387.1 hypothetical protein [Patescibacteria group bacterium]
MKRLLVYYLARNLFFFGAALLILLLIVEDYAPGAITLWFNLRILVIIIFIAGLLALLFSKNNDKI